MEKTATMKKIAECWELSTHKAGHSKIASGKYKGMLLGEYINHLGRRILRRKCEHY